jgi:hypothetical protein
VIKRRGMIRHLIEQPAGWCRSSEIVGTPNQTQDGREL